MVELGNKKNVFWEAFLISAVIFILGLLIGIFVESGRLQQINNYYAEAQVSLMDSLAISNSLGGSSDCELMTSASIEFADRIYEQARLLEKYEDSGKITQSMIIAHKEYDLLRTILWQELMKIDSKCSGKFNYVIYLYNYNTQDLGQRAMQNIWSNLLFDLKQEQGGNLILVPISVSGNLSSLNTLTREFNITGYPALIINGNQTLYSLQGAENVEKYLK